MPNITVSLQRWQLRIGEMISSHPAFDAHCKRVQQLPRVAEYLARRAQTQTQAVQLARP